MTKLRHVENVVIMKDMFWHCHTSLEEIEKNIYHL
jgi:hypothetical protein